MCFLRLSLVSDIALVKQVFHFYLKRVVLVYVLAATLLRFVLEVSKG